MAKRMSTESVAQARWLTYLSRFLLCPGSSRRATPPALCAGRSAVPPRAHAARRWRSRGAAGSCDGMSLRRDLGRCFFRLEFADFRFQRCTLFSLGFQLRCLLLKLLLPGNLLLLIEQQALVVGLQTGHVLGQSLFLRVDRMVRAGRGAWLRLWIYAGVEGRRWMPGCYSAVGLLFFISTQADMWPRQNTTPWAGSRFPGSIPDGASFCDFDQCEGGWQRPTLLRRTSKADVHQEYGGEVVSRPAHDRKIVDSNPARATFHVSGDLWPSSSVTKAWTV